MENNSNVISGAQPRTWYEEDGVIYFNVTTDGTTGLDWPARLKANKLRFKSGADDILSSLLGNLKPTTGITTKIAILTDALTEDRDWALENVHAIAESRKLSRLNIEASCLVCGELPYEIQAMGLCAIVAMHEPVMVGRQPRLLSAFRGGPTHKQDGGRDHWLYGCGGEPESRFFPGGGFAFEVSPMVLKTEGV